MYQFVSCFKKQSCFYALCNSYSNILRELFLITFSQQKSSKVFLASVNFTIIFFEQNFNFLR